MAGSCCGRAKAGVQYQVTYSGGGTSTHDTAADARAAGDKTQQPYTYKAVAK